MTAADELLHALPIRGMKIRAGTYGNCGGVIFAGVDLEAGTGAGVEVVDALTEVPDWAEEFPEDIALYVQSIGEGFKAACDDLFDDEPPLRLVLRTVRFNPVDAVRSVGRKAGQYVVDEAIRIAAPAEARPEPTPKRWGRSELLMSGTPTRTTDPIEGTAVEHQADQPVPASEAEKPSRAQEPSTVTPGLLKPWKQRLRVVIGATAEGAPLELDLKGSADDGMGPHGMLIGAPGSGKVELSRAIISGLALSHLPEEVNFVLLDYGAGGGFDQFKQLPHTRGVFSNLKGQPEVRQWLDQAFHVEFGNRRNLLRDAGDFTTHSEYERARESGQPLEPLPSLLVVLDGFSDLMGEAPDFMATLIQIGRLGRSLGAHMLLATDHMAEGRVRGLDGYLRYRIAMRTQSAMESRIVIGLPDAHELPETPGHGYLKEGTHPLIHFQAAQS